MNRWLFALCTACALALASACEGTETGNPDPSHSLDGGLDFDAGAPPVMDARIHPPDDAGSSSDAGVVHDASPPMDGGPDDDGGP